MQVTGNARYGVGNVTAIAKPQGAARRVMGANRVCAGSKANCPSGSSGINERHKNRATNRQVNRACVRARSSRRAVRRKVRARRGKNGRRRTVAVKPRQNRVTGYIRGAVRSNKFNAVGGKNRHPQNRAARYSKNWRAVKGRCA